MRYKTLMTLQEMQEKNPVTLSGIAELDEMFVLDCYKGAPLPEGTGCKTRKQEVKAAKRGISNEYVAICTGIQRDGNAMVRTVNREKLSGEEPDGIFCGHIAENALIFTIGFYSYHIFEGLTGCSVIAINHEEDKGIFNLNTVNSLHSYIKGTYKHYRGGVTEYINRYNALFSIAFQCVSNLTETLFLCYTRLARIAISIVLRIFVIINW